MKQYEMKSELGRRVMMSHARSDKLMHHSTLGGSPPTGFVQPNIGFQLSRSQRGANDRRPPIHCAEARRRLQAPLQGLQLKSESDEPEYYTRKDESGPWAVPRGPMTRYREDLDSSRRGPRFGQRERVSRRETQRQNRSQILNELRTRQVFKEERLGTRAYKHAFPPKKITPLDFSTGRMAKKIDFSWRENPLKLQTNKRGPGFKQPKDLFSSLVRDRQMPKKKSDFDGLFQRTTARIPRFHEDMGNLNRRMSQRSLFTATKTLNGSQMIPREPPMVKSFVKLGLESLSGRKQTQPLDWETASTQRKLGIFKEHLSIEQDIFPIEIRNRNNVKEIQNQRIIGNNHLGLQNGAIFHQQNQVMKEEKFMPIGRQIKIGSKITSQLPIKTLNEATRPFINREVEMISIVVGRPGNQMDNLISTEIKTSARRRSLNVIAQGKGQIHEVSERKDLLVRCSGCKCINARIETHEGRFLIRTNQNEDLFANFQLNNANVLRSKGDSYPLGNLKQLLLKMLLRELVGPGLLDFNIFEMKFLHAVLMKRFKGLYSGNGNKLRALYAKKGLPIPDDQVRTMLSNLQARFKTSNDEPFKDNIMAQEISFSQNDLKDIRRAFLHPNYLNLMVEHEPVKRLEEQLKFVLSRAEHSLIIEFLEKTQGLSKEQIDRKLKTDRFSVEVAFYQEYFGMLAEEHDIPIQKFYFPRNKNKLVCNSHKTINRTYIHNISLNRDYVSKVRAFISGPLLSAEKQVIRNKVNNKIDKWNTFLHKQLSFGRGSEGLEFFDQFVNKNILHNDKFKLPWSVRQIEEAVSTVLKHLT